MSEKRFFWFRFYADFFEDRRIKRLRQLAGGDTFLIIFQKMMLQALNTDGHLHFDNDFGDFCEELALDLNENADNVRMTVNYLMSVGLLTISPDGTDYFLTELSKFIGSETASAERKRRQREKEKNLGAGQCHTGVTQANSGQFLLGVTQERDNVTKAGQSHADLRQSHNGVTQVSQKCHARDKEINNINISNEILSDNEKNLSDEEDKKIDSNTFEKIIEKWNTLEAYGIKTVRIIGPNTERGKMLRARLKQYGLDSFSEIVEQIKHSDFLQGKHDGRAWQIDFDWLVHPSNYPKVLEGKYRGTYNPQPVNGKARNFINFEQRQEDFEELEKMLLDN